MNDFKSFGRYNVYADGRVYSNITNRWLKPSVDKSGYHSLRLSTDSGVIRIKVHRLVAKVFIPNQNNFPQINHKDGNKSNNKVSNLEWCTAFHNNKHARDSGLNDISKSNKVRWESVEFRETAVSNMSTAAHARNLVGERNPNFKYVCVYQGQTSTLMNIAVSINKSYGFVYRQVQKLLKGDKSYFTEHDLVITKCGYPLD